MREIMTLNEVGEQILGKVINQEFLQVQVVLEDATGYETVVSDDELAKELLSKEVYNSLPEVDVNLEEVDFGLSLKELNIWGNIKNFSLTIFLVALLATGCYASLIILQIFLKFWQPV